MTTRTGVVRLTKKEYMRLGGLENSNLFRKHNGRCWGYFKRA